MASRRWSGFAKRRAGWLVSGLLLLVTALSVAVILSRGDDKVAPFVSAPVAPGAGELDLAQRFAPIYRLRIQDHECDTRGESFVPSPVEVVLGQPGVNLRQQGAAPIPAPAASALIGASEKAYLDYPGDPRKPGCGYEREARLRGAGLPPTVYARVVSESERPGLAIQYWAFYYFNDWNNKHEGDWEMVEVVFAGDTVDEAMRTGPEYVVYAQHGGGERANWDARKLQKVGDRPVVYVSAGSHASYFSASTYLGLGEAGTGFGCDVALPPHRDVDAQVVLVGDLAGTDPSLRWLQFKGRWGQVLSGEFNGPTGPQTKTSWKEPLTWAEGARGGSTTLPGDDLFGVNSVHGFCDTVEAGSQVLLAFMRFPLVVGGSAFLLVGMTSVAGLVLLRDAARSPQLDAPAGFLRRRRSLGQLIRASITLYLRAPGLFLGIAFAFLPLGIVLAFLQGWLVQLPPLNRLQWLLDGNDVSHALLGLLMGGIASFAVYLFVVSGAVAALQMLNDGMQPTVREVYRRAVAGAPGVVLARLRTLAIIALLSLTVIGIPIAAWLAVRWFFVESAVLIDGESHWRAPGESSRAVDGQWFRALRRVLFFGVFSVLAGPVLAVVALLATDANPAIVNVIAGLFHMAVLPFSAIGLSLAYCDLQTGIAEPRRPARAAGAGQRWLGRARRLAMAVVHLFEGRRKK